MIYMHNSERKIVFYKHHFIKSIVVLTNCTGIYNFVCNIEYTNQKSVSFIHKVT